MGEIIIIDSVSSTDRQKVETYLAYKWGVSSQLPAGHPGTSGWSLERSTSVPDDLTLNLAGAGGKFTKLSPSMMIPGTISLPHLAVVPRRFLWMGRKWHRPLSRDRFNFKTFFGDPYASGSNQPKIDDVRFYRGILSAAEISAITTRVLRGISQVCHLQSRYDRREQRKIHYL